MNQGGAVVEGHYPDPWGEAWFNLLNLLFYAFGYINSILPVPHEYHSPCDVATVLFQDAPAEGRPYLYRGHVLYVYGYPIVRADNYILYVLQTLNPAQSPHQVLHVAGLHHPGPHGLIAGLDVLKDPPERDVVGQELVWVYVYLILLDKTPDAGHVGHSGGGLQLIPHEPVLDGPQFPQVVTLTLYRVPEYLPYRSSIRGKVGYYVRG